MPLMIVCNAYVTAHNPLHICFDVSVMISWLFSYPQQLSVLIVGFGCDVSVITSTAEPKDYIYSVALVV